MLTPQLNKLRKTLRNKSDLTEDQRQLLLELDFLANYKDRNDNGLSDLYKNLNESFSMHKATAIASDRCGCCGQKL